MRRHFLIPGALLFASIGCIIDTNEKVAGRPCQTRQDCADPDYDCLPSQPPDSLTCQVVFPRPPPGGRDAGVDAGPLEPAYWCNEVEPLMVKYCAECHGEDRTGSGITGAGFRLDVYEDLDGGAEAGGLDGAKTMAGRIKARMVTPPPTMPPFRYATMPTDAERAVVNRWVTAGAPLCDGGTP